MYLPRSFRQDDLAALHELMRRFSFATLFSQTAEGPFATHLPLLLEAERGPHGTLVAHMARANPHWKGFDGAAEALVVFQGPHAYISPSWYANQVTVPTWNYAAVHVSGTPRIVDDLGLLREQVLRLVEEHERYVDPPWDATRAEPILDAQLRAIVGFEIPIRRIEGKFKFNQNRTREDQEGVAAALADSPDPQRREIAEIMRQNLAGGVAESTDRVRPAVPG